MRPFKDDTGGRLHCPRCTVVMVRGEVERFGPDVRIDVCPVCLGTWLDVWEVDSLRGIFELGLAAEEMGSTGGLLDGGHTGGGRPPSSGSWPTSPGTPS